MAELVEQDLGFIHRYKRALSGRRRRDILIVDDDRQFAEQDGLNQYRDAPFGKVRINAPISIAHFVLGPVLGGLLSANPNLELEVAATDRLVDIVEEGFDAGIRLGESLREAIRPAPETPDDLVRHVCLQNLYPSGVRYPWSFEREKRAIDVRPLGPLSSDDHDLLVRTALSGIGLAYVWEDRAAAFVADGRLVRCLDDWCSPEDWLYLYYPTRKYISAGLRAVIQAMRA